MTDHWITDPREHRKSEQTGGPEDGADIETVFGTAKVIRLDRLSPVDEWVCDSCNADIYIGTVDDSWPVASVGGYALCMDCTHRIGVYPTERCACWGCDLQFTIWQIQLAFRARRAS